MPYLWTDLFQGLLYDNLRYVPIKNYIYLTLFSPMGVVIGKCWQLFVYVYRCAYIHIYLSTRTQQNPEHTAVYTLQHDR